jgi:hypothetical protein
MALFSHAEPLRKLLHGVRRPHRGPGEPAAGAPVAGEPPAGKLGGLAGIGLKER